MAKIDTPPALSLIDWFRGSLDFYEWRGIHVVRSWPHWPKRAPSPKEKDCQDRFAYITKAWTDLDPYLKGRYLVTARGTNYTARDTFTRFYLRGMAI